MAELLHDYEEFDTLHFAPDSRAELYHVLDLKKRLAIFSISVILRRGYLPLNLFFRD